MQSTKKQQVGVRGCLDQVGDCTRVPDHPQTRFRVCPTPDSRIHSSHFFSVQANVPASTLRNAAPFFQAHHSARKFGNGERVAAKGDGQQGGGSQGELGEGPTIADLQGCWVCHEQSYQR